MKKRIVLCADDYGLAQPISQAIVNLIEKGNVTATSCLVNSQEWLNHARWLAPFQSSIDIGLHFNLTEGVPLSADFKQAYGCELTPLPQLLRRAFTRGLKIQPLIAECAAQLDHFVEAMGRLPDFIDGHQHVHQFPVVRDALLHVYRERHLQSYLRVVNPPILSGGLINAWKKTVIHLTGTKRWLTLVSGARIPHNLSFSGIYDFDQAQQYAVLFKQFLSETTDKGIIMCHPSLAGSPDGIARAREAEYQYLASKQFRVDCGAYEVETCRMPRQGGLSMSE